MSTPISVFTRFERGSRLYEPTKPIRRSKEKVFACKLAPPDFPTLLAAKNPPDRRPVWPPEVGLIS